MRTQNTENNLFNNTDGSDKMPNVRSRRHTAKTKTKTIAIDDAMSWHATEWKRADKRT